MSGSPRLRRVTLGVLVAAVALGACSAASTTPGGIQNGNPADRSSANPSGAPGAGPSVAAVSVPPALRGTYQATVIGTTASSGDWILEITATDLLLQNPVGGDPFSLDPSAVTETQLSVPPSTDCPDQTTVTDGVYTISLSGDKLSFTALHDSCGDRKAILTTTSWTRRSAP